MDAMELQWGGMGKPRKVQSASEQAPWLAPAPTFDGVSLLSWILDSEGSNPFILCQQQHELNDYISEKLAVRAVVIEIS